MTLGQDASHQDPVWYLDVEGTQSGPYSADQLLGFLKEGEVLAHHRATTAQLSGRWVSMDELLDWAESGRALSEMTGPKPPPPPPPRKNSSSPVPPPFPRSLEMEGSDASPPPFEFEPIPEFPSMLEAEGGFEEHPPPSSTQPSITSSGTASGTRPNDPVVEELFSALHVAREKRRNHSEENLFVRVEESVWDSPGAGRKAKAFPRGKVLIALILIACLILFFSLKKPSPKGTFSSGAPAAGEEE